MKVLGNDSSQPLEIACMSLRDYFAAQSLKFFIGAHEDENARKAYAQADAMLAAREVKS